MSKQKILILLGSTRVGRMGERVAQCVQKTVEDNGMEPVLFGKARNAHFIILVSLQSQSREAEFVKLQNQ